MGVSSWPTNPAEMSIRVLPHNEALEWCKVVSYHSCEACLQLHIDVRSCPTFPWGSQHLPDGCKVVRHPSHRAPRSCPTSPHGPGVVQGCVLSFLGCAPARPDKCNIVTYFATGLAIYARTTCLGAGAARLGAGTAHLCTRLCVCVRQCGPTFPLSPASSPL